MKNHNFLRTAVLLLILTLTVAAASHIVRAEVPLENVKTWYWNSYTYISSVVRGDVDGDGQVEIVTGGYHYDGTRYVAQLCVWNGATLALENVKTWYWTSSTYVYSVAVGNVDGDGQVEIVTGGYYFDGAREVAQLCVWNGATLALENVKTWYWTGNTEILSVAIGNVDGDGQMEIVTGGNHYDGIRPNAQLCVWNGATLALEKVQTWYWTGSTNIRSVAVGNVDGDAQVEIVTGGYYYDGSRNIAQLCVWNGATLALENIKTWYWTSNTAIFSVSVGNVDGDGSMEIVTGGGYNDGTRVNSQLCVWNGATLALENIKTWYWTSNTQIWSVALGDVESDNAVEIVTGGYYNDGSRSVAQLCVWSGATLALENIKTWYWTASTVIMSVAVGDADDDGKTEMTTGGTYYDGTRDVAQLCVWSVPAINPSWHFQTVDSAGDVGWYSSLALDSNSNPQISYFDPSNGDLKVAWFDGSWHTEIVDSTGTVGWYPSLVLDSNNYPHISYRDSNSGLKYAAFDGSTYQIQTVDSIGNVGQWSSLALDSNGNPQISYYDLTNGDLKVAWFDGSWHTEIVDSAGNVGSYSSFAFDSNGNPQISYYDGTNGDLKVAWFDGSWHTEIVDSAGNVGTYSSLALDSNNYPHISYYDETNSNLKYAAFDGSTYLIQTVDSIGNVGQFTSLALDSNGNPQISYYDQTNGDLKDAWFDGSWHTETVDSGGNVGSYTTSLALDSSNYPHISYYDQTNGNLKYAWFG